MTQLEFEHPEDRQFFEELLVGPGECLEDYADLFDFRSPEEKRSEYNRILEETKADLLERFGETCMLETEGICDLSSGLVVDHVIPLSSNILNKDRGVPTSRTPNGKLKKTPSQSFGSNGRRNLILACGKCNGYKKHRLPDGDTARRILGRMSG